MSIPSTVELNVRIVSYHDKSGILEKVQITDGMGLTVEGDSYEDAFETFGYAYGEYIRDNNHEA